MFSSILRDSRSKRRRVGPNSPTFTARDRDNNTISRSRQRRLSDNREDDDLSAGEDSDVVADEEDEDEEAESSEDTPLLPIFDSSLLDALPIYALTHTVRLMVSEKCETVLSWEQLRSPQVSQFLLKPIQQEIRTNHFSAAIIYVLMANCLQFTKEVATNPGNSGTSKTRAMICELIAIKLLREYTTRGLIDALSYDFDPLQGQGDLPAANPATSRADLHNIRKAPTKSARISCLEIAIRAQAKRFLAHPLVVQQLQAIWDGSIVFHNAADSLHRKGVSLNHPGYGTIGQLSASRERKAALELTRPRKMVMIYNPKDASLFKLSRLRVPRYRSMLSTVSLAILLVLFVAVLVDRELEITSLQVIFWFWTAGYMLDEVVTFTEQGFGLYIASFWNTFDLGILLLLIIHFSLRLYGLVIPTAHKHSTANMAYDILAASAILLFPRLFSVLDHYRYFSQLIIAFRMMAADLMAVFILIVIACSGFFVALSLSFGQDSPDDPRSIGFALLQLLLGFTPAAWDRWGLYTPLGRFILTFYMFITHFVVVTILVSVLTNSFMAVVQNANEEHQFLFAVNTISSVKSDSLFSYVPPLNIIQWLMTPTRYFLPFRQYIQWNRTIIKVSHSPILLCIYVYERVVLQPAVVDRLDLIETRRKGKSIAQRLPRLLREPSRVNFRQDQALEEVFRQPFDETLRTAFARNQRKSSNVVNKWMNDMGEGTASPPEEQDRTVLNKLEKQRPLRRNFSAFSRGRNFSRRATSVVSDPAEMLSHADFFSPSPRMTPNVEPVISQDDADGDDELLTDDLEDDDRFTSDYRGQHDNNSRPPGAQSSNAPSDVQRNQKHGSETPMSTSNDNFLASKITSGIPTEVPSIRRVRAHERTISSGTILFNPVQDSGTSDQNLQHVRLQRPSIVTSAGTATSSSKQNSESTGRKTPRKKNTRDLRPALIKRNDAAFRSTPNIKGLTGFSRPEAGARRASLEMDLVSDIGDNKALGGGYVGAIPASFATQMAYAKDGIRQLQQERHDEQERLSRLMMARMNSLEEGFRDVIHEMRESIKPQLSTSSKHSQSGDRSPRLQIRRERETVLRGKERQIKGGSGSGSGAASIITVGSPSNEASRRPRTAVHDARHSMLSVGSEVDTSAGLEDSKSSKGSKEEAGKVNKDQGEESRSDDA